MSRIARLIEFQELAPEIRHFVFEVPGVERLVFEPGQFVSLTRVIDGEPLTRAYSIASAPDGDNRFELCLNHVPEGPFSTYLFQLQRGDEVALEGPLGYFVLRQPVREALFVATGTGIAPIRSMLGHLLGQGNGARLQLLFGSRHPGTILYRDEFEQLAARHPNFRFHPTLSRAPESWTGRRGHVQQHLFDLLEGRTDVDVYVCGLKAMVNDVRARLKAAGFDRKHIIYEKYD
jgi:CDP-4-dehydro-6-deoxyglucose reductase